MILDAGSIRSAIAAGCIAIEPFDEAAFKEASYTFHLGDKLMVYAGREPVDACESVAGRRHDVVLCDDGFALLPGQFVVGELHETVTLDSHVACFLSVRGSCAQAGLDALNSDLFIEPGWSGRVALAITNRNSVPIVVRKGMKIVKGVFFGVCGKHCDSTEYDQSGNSGPQSGHPETRSW